MKTLYSMYYVRVATIMGSHCCFRLKPLICCFDLATYGKQAQRIGFYSDDASSVYLSFSLSWLTFFLLCLIQLRSTKVVVLLFPLRPELVELFSAKLKSRLVDYLTVVHLPIEPHQHMQFKNFKKNCLYTSACMYMYTVKASWDSVPHNNNINNNKQ